MKLEKHLLFLVLTLLLSSCNQEHDEINITSEDYHKTLDKLTEVMIHDIFSPPVASRIYVYPNIAAYETLNRENDTYKTLSSQLNGLDIRNIETSSEKINLRLAALIAYMDTAKELIFSKEKFTVYRDSLYSAWQNINKQQFKNSKVYGLGISKQVIAWMNDDNYAKTRSMPDYNIYTNDESRWEPTPPAYMKGIEPHWNKLRPFALDSVSQFRPKTHPKFSLDKNSDFYKELLEVYDITNQIRAKGDQSDEVAMARFWDCNPFVTVNKGHFMFAEKKITPGAHWIGICKIACQMTDADFEKTVYAYTKTSIAAADAFISCWDEKYRSNLIRPETLINKYIDLNWAPILQTPPFPEYTSGHSVVSGASSEVLTAIFGDNFAFDDTTELPYGLPVRSYNSFEEAAEEAAMSRLYGGIHYMSAIEIGLEQGKVLGKMENEKLDFLRNKSILANAQKH